MTQVSLVNKGRTFIRGVIAKGIVKSGNREDIERLAASRWGDYQGREAAKAAVLPIDADDFSGGTKSEIIQLATGRSLLQKIPGLREVPFNIRLVSMAGGARGYFVAEGKPAPLSAASIAGSSLVPTKVQGLIVATEEALLDPKSERALQKDIERPLQLTLDEAFIGSSPGIAGEIPAGIGFGATQISASGSSAEAFRNDLAAAFELYQGDIESAVLVMHPRTALSLSMLQQPLGSASFGVRGGDLFDVPVATSAGVTWDSSGSAITLLDASAIAFGVGALQLEIARHADLQMSDAPDETSGEGTVMISLWQSNLVGFKATIYTNWEVQRPGSVVQITGVNYG